MVSINYAFKEICCKIVFYGPGLSGKTTNLQHVHKKIPSPTRGELISLATDQDRTLYFDFLPVDIGKINGFSVKFQLYTVPGQVYYNATRKLVLRGVDGLVFVADSQRSKMDENIESYQNLMENLNEYRYDIDQLPLVFQYNKRDLSDLSSVEELARVLNPKSLPHFEAVATQGMGVFDTLRCISKLVLDLAKGKKAVPEREIPAEQVVMAESELARPEAATSSEDLGASASVSPLPESPELWGKEEAVEQEKIPSASEEWSDSTGDQIDYEPPLLQEEKEVGAEKEEMVSQEFTPGQQEGGVESAQSRPRIEESPTIISWSAARQKEKSEPKRLFLWRFFQKLFNR
jgi:signal recognition particle receptor subunit beta